MRKCATHLSSLTPIFHLIPELLACCQCANGPIHPSLTPCLTSFPNFLLVAVRNWTHTPFAHSMSFPNFLLVAVRNWAIHPSFGGYYSLGFGAASHPFPDIPNGCFVPDEFEVCVAVSALAACLASLFRAYSFLVLSGLHICASHAQYWGVCFSHLLSEHVCGDRALSSGEETVRFRQTKSCYSLDKLARIVPAH